MITFYPQSVDHIRFVFDKFLRYS